MAIKRGIVIRSKKHNMILLNTSDKIGRLSGSHVVDIPFNQTKEIRFDHSDLLKFGKVFTWFDCDFMQGVSGELNLTVASGVIILNFKNLYVNGLVGEWAKKITIYYGVHYG